MKFRREVVFAAALLALGCASRGEADTRRELLGEWTQGLVVPLYAELEQSTAALPGLVDTLCETPDQANLDAVRAAWQQSREPLKRAEVFAFGPFSRPEYRIGPDIDSWPARVDRVEELLSEQEAVTVEVLSQQGAWLKGSPVAEYFLFAGEPSALEALQDPKRCGYLQAVAQLLATRSRDLHMAWSPEGGDFAGEISSAGRESTAFRSLQDAFGEIVNRIGFTLENIRRDKLGRPLGEESGGTPQPDAVESRFSGRSVQDIRDNLWGIRSLFWGSEADGAFRGLNVYLRERGYEYGDRFDALLGTCESELDAMDQPLSELVTADSQRVQQLSDSLGELQRLVQVDMIGALGLTISYNDNDGD